MHELPELEPRELARYARHVSLPELGERGQRRLKAGSVLLVGAGGLGSPAALYLAAAGVGRLGIVDFDAVDLSNLQRQVLHGTSSLGVAKVDSAAARLADLNPDIVIERHPLRFWRALSAALALVALAQAAVLVSLHQHSTSPNPVKPSAMEKAP